MAYVDGYLTPVPVHCKAAFIALGRRTGAVLKEYGARRIVECWIDEASGDDSQFHAAEARGDLAGRTSAMVTTFAQALRIAPDEAVVFSWIEWPDRETRDKGLAAAMADPRMQMTGEDAVFDGRRLIASGFLPILDL